MTDTEISATVFPQDEGTGVSEGDGDYNSAGHVAALARSTPILPNVMARGQAVSYNSSDETASVGPLMAFVPVDGVDVQDDSIAYGSTLGGDAAMCISVGEGEDPIQVESGATSEVHLAFDPTGNDAVYVRHGSSVSTPSDPSVYLGDVDASGGSVRDRWAGTAPIHNWDGDGGGYLVSVGRDDVGWSQGRFLKVLNGSGGTVASIDFGQAGGDTPVLRYRDGDGNVNMAIQGGSWTEFPNIAGEVVLKDNISWDRAKDTGYGLRYPSTNTCIYLAAGSPGGADPSNLHGFEARVDGNTYWKKGYYGDTGSVIETFFQMEQAKLWSLDTDPRDPEPGETTIWQSDGTGSGGDGDVMVKVTDSNGTTKTGTLFDFSEN